MKTKAEKGSLFLRFPDFLGLGRGVGAFDRPPVLRGRQALNHRIQKLGDADIPQSRSAENREKGFVENAFFQTLGQLFRREFLSIQVFLQEGVIRFGDHFDQFFPGALGFFLQVCRDFFFRKFAALVAIEVESFLGEKIHYAGKGVFGADGQIQRNGLGRENLLDVRKGLGVVGPLAVHLGDEKNPGQIELVGVIPHFFRRHFHAGDGVDDHDRSVHGLEAVFGVDDEVGVSRGIDDVDLVFLPLYMVERGTDTQAVFDFLRLKIHHRGSIVDPPEAVRGTSVKKHGFSKRSLARFSVANQGDVA